MTAFTFPSETPAWFIESYRDGGTDPGEDPRDFTLVLASPDQNPEIPVAQWNLLSSPSLEGEVTMVHEGLFPPETSLEDILTAAGEDATHGIDAQFVIAEGEDNAVMVPIVYLYGAATLASEYTS